MLGTGRFGGILGAFSGAFLMQAQLSFETIFTFLAIPALVSALALMVKYWVGKRQLPLTQSATEDLSSATQKPDYVAWRELFRQAIKICASLHWLCRKNKFAYINLLASSKSRLRHR